MKRSLIVLLVAVALGLGSIVSAQAPHSVFDQKMSAFTSSGAQTIEETLLAMADTYKFGLMIDSDVVATMRFRGTLPPETLHQMIDQLLTYAGSVAEYRDNQVIVHRKQAERAIATTTLSATPTGDPNSRSISLQEQIDSATSLAEVNRLTFELGAMRQNQDRMDGAMRRPLMTGYSRGYDDTYDGYLNFDVIRDRMLRDQNYRETWGTLKFKNGTNQLLTHIQVMCGENDYIGGASDANNFYEHEMLVEVACGSQLELQYTDAAGKRLGIPFHTRIVPFAVQKALHQVGTRIVLTNDLINSARELKAYTQHVWVEK